MRRLHEVPRFSDRWSQLYLEHGRLDCDSGALVFHDADGDHQVPIDQLALLMLGPGTTVTQASMRALAENSCMVSWVGDHGVRTYAHSTGSTFSAKRLLTQARLASQEDSRLAVARRMYTKRFPGQDVSNKTIEQLRGMEGLRVRHCYEEWSKKTGVPWDGRSYDQDDWFRATAVNRYLSTANSCLYGLCHAAIVSAGYSAALGFIHVGKMLSFVYDIADLYKSEVTVPLAFNTAMKTDSNLEREVRLACRVVFHQAKLMRRILPDIVEVLDAPDDLGETAEELEGKAISLADGTKTGGVSGALQQESS